MTGKSEGLLELARAVADGARPDWDAAASAIERGESRDVVEALRFLAGVLEAHRTLHGGGLPAASTPDTAPRRWGPLELHGELGAGSFGQVYRARDPQLDRSVALKLRDVAADEAAAAVREGRLLARVRHPNVVTVHGADHHDGRFGIWMELIEGQTLAALVRERGRLGARETISVGLDLCAALAAVHEAGLVHGDVKPHNVVRESGGRLVLMDFGAGHEQRGSAGGAATVSGTPLFLAPEVLNGAAKTVRSDIYALGVLLYFLLTARHPFEAADLDELREAHAAGRGVPLRDLRPALPSALVEAVDRALDPDPGRRFGSAGELERALLAAQRGRPSSGVRRLALALAVGAALIATVLAFTYFRGTSPVPPPPPTSMTATPAFGIEATLWRAGLTVDQPLRTGDRVHPGDQLFVDVESEADVYVYVINLDLKGRGYVLFPVAGAQWRNPLRSGRRYRLPGGTDWEYDSWEVSSAGGEESILIVASPVPLTSLESAVSRLEPATGEGPAELSDETLIALRGVGKLSSSGDRTSARGEAADAVSAALRGLSEEPLSRERLFVREIVLDNP